MKTASLIVVFLIVLLLAACGSNATPASAPTAMDINAVQTAAVQTIVANITATANAQPTLEPTETPAPVKTAAPVVVASPSAPQCNNATFVSDASVADGTHMTAGQAFIKSWRVSNTGSCSWKTTYKIIYGYGEKMSGLPAVLTAEVLPNTQAEISVNLKAPLKAGNYSGYWRLSDNNGLPFGQFFSVIIIVP
jgi:hypothetical protein